MWKRMKLGGTIVNRPNTNAGAAISISGTNHTSVPHARDPSGLVHGIDTSGGCSFFEENHLACRRHEPRGS